MYLTNHSISNLISKINYGVQKRLRFLNIEKDLVTLKILKIFYTNGIIRSYKILNDKTVSIYFKYNNSNKIINLSIISKPSNRIF
jgi:ribosomal protein S8